MKYYTFYREDNKFDDILKDPILKKFVSEKIKWANHLMIGFNDYSKDFEKNQVYVTLKYGDDIVTDLTKDYSPKVYVDYTPNRK
jgi:hypothetical protein